ncbi:hypothetical protein Vadar_011961 [Vaccinium darrowii]|uniref:Uncharacterized protein n=1 Tax=Vaccinium darrowii TaxID=229202 RepID=A0ACB7YUK2_9ERIC|nr:hypothetical protein Vadar_011961 [Vaccinium darrowii]
MLTVRINSLASALSTTIKHLTGKLQFLPPKGLSLSRQNGRITLTVSSMAATVSHPLKVCVKASVTTPNWLGEWFSNFPNVAFFRKTKKRGNRCTGRIDQVKGPRHVSVGRKVNKTWRRKVPFHLRGDFTGYLGRNCLPPTECVARILSMHREES